MQTSPKPNVMIAGIKLKGDQDVAARLLKPTLSKILAHVIIDWGWQTPTLPRQIKMKLIMTASLSTEEQRQIRTEVTQAISCYGKAELGFDFPVMPQAPMDVAAQVAAE